MGERAQAVRQSAQIAGMAGTVAKHNPLWEKQSMVARRGAATWHRACYQIRQVIGCALGEVPVAP